MLWETTAFKGYILSLFLDVSSILAAICISLLTAKQTSEYAAVLLRKIGKISVCLLLICLSRLNHRNERPFVLTANGALVGTLMTMGDLNDIFPIPFTQ